MHKINVFQSGHRNFFRHMVKYWIKLTDAPEGSLIKDAYMFNLDLIHNNQDSWLSPIRALLLEHCKYSSECWHNQRVNMKNKVPWLCKIKSSLNDIYKINWILNMNNFYPNLSRFDKQSHCGKLLTYKTIKNNLNFERYLELVPERSKRINFTKMRISNHILQVEKGRHSSKMIPYEQRLCKLCTLNHIEDEYHFTMICPKYSVERNDFLKMIYEDFPCIKTLTLKEQFKYFFETSESDVLIPFINFIDNIYCKRKLSPVQ